MTRIFFYELKRLLWNQFFVGILAVILFTGWQILNQVTLLGIEQTAPFSVQSFCDYLLRLLPLLWIGTLFFLSFFFSKSEQRTSVITHATPVNPLIYAFIRCSAAFVGSLLLIAAVFLLAAVFYRRFFAQQFKRSCLPDGPKVGSVALSPRGDWRMPSDASYQIWAKELETL